MSVTIETIKDLEKMTKLQFSESEREAARDYLIHLTGQFDEMEKIQASEVEPLISVTNLKNVLREDKASQMLTREELFKNAVEENNGYFQVPKTID